MRRTRSLDGVRAVAVLAVIGSHLHLPGLADGGVGVNVFFVLSGYLITTLLMREWDAGGSISLSRFYARRALRLLPALVVLVIGVVTYALVVQRHDDHRLLLSAVPFVVFYAGNWRRAFGSQDDLSWFGHTWSLSIEEQFYFLWPLILIAAARWRGRRAVLVTALVGSVASLMLRLMLWDGPASLNRVYNGTDTVADQLLIGCVLAILVSIAPQAVTRTCKVALWPAALLLAAAASTTAFESFRYTVGYTLIAVAAAVIVGRLATAPEGVLSRTLSLRPLAFLGLISYGVYLWHFPILLAAKGHITSLPVLTAFVLSATFATAFMSWRLVEQPVLRLKSRVCPTTPVAARSAMAETS